MSDAQISSNKLPSILVEDITKTYGDFRALNRISFEIQPGEIVGFLGPNGAGKSTTMKIFTCLMPATEGRAAVAGFDVYTQSKQVRSRVGYLPENVPLYEDMIVYDYLNFIAEMREVPRAQRRKNLDEAVERTGLGAVIQRDIHELSKGYRQRVGLAQAIIHRPNVLILDEPTTGLDPNQLIELRDVIKDLGRQNTIILSTHILQEVSAVCDRIIIINRGEIVADDTLDGLKQELPGRFPDWQKALGEDSASAAPKEPTLEDIFRVYTAGSTEENR